MLSDLLLALVPLFVVVDPFASIGLFLGLTSRHDRKKKIRIALRACLFAAAVLVGFAFAGQALLEHMGIELYSLRVAGGILLVLIGLNMLREGEELPSAEIQEGESRYSLPTGGTHSGEPVAHDPSFVPLGLPMLAGPGAISLVILQGTNHSLGIVGLAIAITMAASFIILWATARASHVIGDNPRRVVTRIMGLLTVAFAVQYVFDGVNGWLASHSGAA